MDGKTPEPESRREECERQNYPAEKQERPIYPWKITRRTFMATAGVLTGGMVMGFPIRGSGLAVAEIEDPDATGRQKYYRLRIIPSASP